MTRSPELEHRPHGGDEDEPQNLDLIRRHLSWTPAERLQNLRQAAQFVTRARAGQWSTVEHPAPKK